MALVNRSPRGTVPSDFAPADLVDMRTGKSETPPNCDKGLCLRKDAYDAYVELRDAMKKDGHTPYVESAFRSYDLQCVVFQRWATVKGFCEAAQDSALPGHSQHQLGTAIDVFTYVWVTDPRGVYRPGFGCSPGGAWLREHAWEYGFVLSYPEAPEDAGCAHPQKPTKAHPRTGYRYEPWHYRFVNKVNAKAFHEAGKRTPSLTLEDWLRAHAGLKGDPDKPVCDGCNCSACATLDAEQGPCRDQQGDSPDLLEGDVPPG
jgi:D-alanyl-D-alanine carboxypeptidase